MSNQTYKAGQVIPFNKGKITIVRTAIEEGELFIDFTTEGISFSDQKYFDDTVFYGDCPQLKQGEQSLPEELFTRWLTND